MRKVYLHGSLGQRFQPEFSLDVETAGEAVRALSIVVPGFLETIRDGNWHLVRGETIADGLSLGEEDVPAFRLGRGDLHIVPSISGGKNDGGLKTVIGVALIGGAFALSGGLLATPLMASGLLSGLTYGNVAMIGLGLALSGASSLLSPDQKDKSKKVESFTFSGPTNTYGQGSPVPLVYGEVITGGVVVSAGIDIEKLAAA